MTSYEPATQPASASSGRPAVPTGDSDPPRRPVPTPPPGGLIARGYCTYLRRSADGTVRRARQYYYRENPDRWAAETQSDMLWLTEAEWKSLVPADPRPGQRHDVAPAIQRRFFCTLGIDYMEGSVNSLPARETTMSLRVGRVDRRVILMRLDGYAKLGAEFDARRTREPNSRGSEVRVRSSGLERTPAEPGVEEAISMEEIGGQFQV